MPAIPTRTALFARSLPASVLRASCAALPALALSAAFATGFAGQSLAAGSDDSAAPKPTNTTKTCKGAKVWDDQKQRCVAPKHSSLDPDEMYDAVRELAYAGRYGDAQAVLAAMPDQMDSRVLTYWGFTYRKQGYRDQAMSYYTRAIALDPQNHLARSYMGQGFVAEGKYGLALEQWKLIRAAGGSGSWAEVSLREALLSGQTQSY
ncbi:tetratricopeptide repeat protein [Phaeobacter sp. JH20_02]|uniref:tetratricopeptide repeat protein n=1 Tax=unclassified Phaeobacter TaxID=2621772 RepID=UPI003A8820C2